MALSTKELQKRIEYLKALDRNMQKISNKNILQAKKLVSIVVGDSIDLTSNSEIGGLLSSLDEEIELELKEDMYNTVVDSIKEVAQMGTMHTVVASSSILKDKAFDFLGLADRLALDYINRIEKDGKKLSDRIWSEDDKQAIYNEVYNGIRNGLNSYEVAKNIEEQVTKGIPKYSIERVANTEMHYAYSRAKIDTAVAEAEEFPELENYIEVKLSPAHPKPDICDVMQGTYKASEAPIPPFHPGCLCITRNIVRPSSKKIDTTNVRKQLKEFKDSDLLNVGKIETSKKTYTIPKTESTK